ncbi:MAG: RrF2 family transcriptional regulator [Candidatus Marinamargulisbacteria bacterium]
MNITKKHQYGLAAMMQLGFFFEQGPVQLRFISDKANVPHAFLEQLILDLKKARLVKSTRGAKGGYQLATSPQNISVEDIFSAIDPLACEAKSSDALVVFWANFNQHVSKFLNVSLQSVMEDALNKEQVLTYTI